jgi:Porin subfamily
MKLKSLLFGSAAVIAAGTGAQAADLPTVEPVEYVRICDAFGAQFYYIPGTDTCLRVGGYVRAESHYVDGNHVGRLYGTASDNVNNWTTRARGHIVLDARTQTDFGLVRAYIAYDMTVGPASTAASGTADSAGLDVAYIQISNDWGTYTAGHTGSFFDFFSGYGYGTRLSLNDGTGSATLFGWTFAGGNGFSLTISAEDAASIGRRKAGAVGNAGTYRGQEFPDGVANIRVDQGWGSAQLMGAVHAINTSTSTELGWAAGAGFEINMPGGWSIGTQGGYSEGAIGYISGDPGGVGDFDTGNNLNKSWAVYAGIKGPLFNPNLTAWVDGSYIRADNPGAGGANYDNWNVRVGAKYSPVSGLGIGPEFAYQNFDGSTAGTDYDVWGLMWRVQRDF